MPRSTKSKSAPKSKKSTPKPKAEPVPEPAPAPVPTQNEVVEDAAPAPEEVLEQRFTSLLEQLTTSLNVTRTLIREVRELKKSTEREIKAAYKKRRKQRNSDRKPSGFIKPTLISDELAAFLGVPKGTEMARNQVTKAIHEYAKTHNLQNPENKRQIFLDTKLSKLLGVAKNEVVTYFNLQRYTAKHFAKHG